MARARALLGDATARLAAAGIDTPALDARLLLAHALDVAPGALALADPPVTAADEAAFAALIRRRAERVPVSRLIGRRGFWTLELAIGPDTLDPRPASETLVRAMLDRLAQGPGRILDLGTGSGALLLAILSERPRLTGLGIDRSEGAIALARRNARDHGLSERALFAAGDWAEAVTGRFDAVLSNPPYIAAPEIAALEPEVRVHDPRLALDGGPDGLAPYPGIARAARRLLAPGAPFAVEIGETQGPAVAAILAAAGFAGIAVDTDLDGHPRVVSGRAP